MYLKPNSHTVKLVKTSTTSLIFLVGTRICKGWCHEDWLDMDFMVVYKWLIFSKGISMGMLEGIWGFIMSSPFLWMCMGFNGISMVEFCGTSNHQSDIWVWTWGIDLCCGCLFLGGKWRWTNGWNWVLGSTEHGALLNVDSWGVPKIGLPQ